MSKPQLFLIGCGPGAVDLLTLRAVERVRQCDIVLYDRLVDPEVLSLAHRTTECIYVGKGCGDGGRQQAEINALLRNALMNGKAVARLKSGDPMVFGRAKEEVAIAIELGAEVEIVPGVTAALAAAADAHIPVTERVEIHSFVVTTARTAEGFKTPDWVQFAKPGLCVAFYMGVAQAWRIQTALMAAGVPGAAPIDWIENAGRDEMRQVSGCLRDASYIAEREQVTNPAILFVRYPHCLASALTMPRQALPQN